MSLHIVKTKKVIGVYRYPPHPLIVVYPTIWSMGHRTVWTK